MEANTSAAPSPSPSSGSRPADTNSADWRSDFKPETRKQVIQKLIDCFTKKFPIESHSDYNKVKVMAVDYEEKMYHHIRNKDEYIRMINTKLHELENLNPSHLNHSEADETSTHSGSAGVPSELPVTPSTKDNVGHAKQLPLQFTKKKFLHPSRPETHMQHQQREFLQPSQLNYPQQSLIQMNQTHPAMLQAAAQHHLQDHHRSVNQQSLSLQQPLQSLSRQQREHPTLHHQSNSLRQSNPIPQQLVLPSQQRQQFVYQKPNMQQIQMLGQPNKVPDMQQQQQTHQRSFGQTNNVICQTQKIQATPLQHQQQLGPQNNIYLPKQQQILGSQSSVSSMEPCQKSMRMQQGRCQSQQQYQKQYHQPSMTSLISQGQSQYPLSQQQLMPQIQSQQQVTMHQPQNSLQTEKQERIQASSVMVQSYISMEQQNQSIQSQTGQKEVSSQSLNDSTGLAGAVDWQEEIYQKIKSMKESYLPELYKKQQNIALKFQQEERLSPVERSEDFEKIKIYMSSLKKLIEILETSKNDVKADWREKMPDYERFIVTLLSSAGRKKLAPVQSQTQQNFQHPRVQVRSPIPEEPEKLTGTTPTTPVNVGHQQAEVAQSQTPQNFQNSGGQDIFSTPAELEKPTRTMLTTEANCGYQQTDFAPPPAQDTSIAPRQISGSSLPVELTNSNENQTNTTTSLPSKSKSISKEDPMDRLIKLIETIPYEALRCSIRDIKSVVRMRDTVAGSAPGNTSRSSIGEDLAATTKWHLKAKNFISQNGSTTTQKMKRSISAICCDDTSEIEPTAKRQKAEANQDLLEEVLETNQQLCFTVIGIIDEEDDSGATLTSNGGGTMVKSSFKTASFSPNLRSKFFSGQMSPITPLRFLIPTDYPKCSPTILDRLQVDQSTESEALSAKVWSVFDRLTRSLEQPVSLREMANTWDISVHKVIAEYDKQSGGGSFGSTYGGWESC